MAVSRIAFCFWGDLSQIHLRVLRCAEELLAQFILIPLHPRPFRRWSATGQRSNQLNYVPTLFSSGLLETSVFAVFPRFPRVPLLPPFPPRITNFGR